MKRIQLTLTVIFFIHIICLFYVNVFSFQKFTGNETARLNSFGKIFLKDIKLTKPNKIVEKSIAIYTGVTGTNRGYEFFSPNVNSGSAKLSFISSKNESLSLFHSPESKMKFTTLNYYINSYLHNESLRTDIIQSIFNRYLSKQNEIESVKVQLNIIQYPYLEEDNLTTKKEKIILISNVTR